MMSQDGLSGTKNHARGNPMRSGMTQASSRILHHSDECSIECRAIPATHTNISPKANAMPEINIPHTPAIQLIFSVRNADVLRIIRIRQSCGHTTVL